MEVKSVSVTFAVPGRVCGVASDDGVTFCARWFDGLAAPMGVELREVMALPVGESWWALLFLAERWRANVAGGELPRCVYVSMRLGDGTSLRLEARTRDVDAAWRTWQGRASVAAAVAMGASWEDAEEHQRWAVRAEGECPCGECARHRREVEGRVAYVDG